MLRGTPPFWGAQRRLQPTNLSISLLIIFSMLILKYKHLKHLGFPVKTLKQDDHQGLSKPYLLPYLGFAW